MFGLLNLNKPSGVSSRQAIDHVQRLVRPVKVGHTGTLDPLATGVLVVTLGAATRLTSRIQAWPKSYRGTFLLGRSSDTEDVEGQVVELSASPVPSRAELQVAVRSFTGTISQQPPAFSALKVQGQRAYKLARQGRDVHLAARQVTIHDLQIERYDYPQLVLQVTCSSGTYLRSLGRDLARAVGTDAVMSALMRTAVGHLTVDSAVAPDQLDRVNLTQYLISPVEAVGDLPQVVVREEQLRRLVHGHEIRLPNEHAAEVAALTDAGDLVAVLWHLGNHAYRPKRNFVAQLPVDAPASDEIRRDVYDID